MSNTGNLDSVTGGSGTDNTSDESTALAVIEEQAEARIRRVWYEDRWFFSVIDVVGVLTDSPTPNKYWTDMRRRITDEGFVQLAAKCRKFKLEAADGKSRQTDVADTETVLRIIQSIPFYSLAQGRAGQTMACPSRRATVGPRRHAARDRHG